MPDMDAKVLALVGDVMGLIDLREFRLGLLEALHATIPSDWTSVNQLGPRPGDVAVVMIPPAPPGMVERFGRLAHENPLVRHYSETGDGRAYRFSDFVSAEEYHRLAIYREVYLPLQVEHQLAFTLPAPPAHLIGVALSRSAPDYTEEDCALVNRARPFLIQAFRNALEMERRGGGVVMVERLCDAGLSEREAEVVARVAHGASNAAAAADLGLSPRTVQKHLEHAYRKLEVADRSAAAAAAWRLAGVSV
ncbi:MAG TPA: LuxR C-terminal-related transcriptional regulator [Solirubrobacteraceae bacterium]|jgi:DNA-binding CsgD family transcriptional regulator